MLPAAAWRKAAAALARKTARARRNQCENSVINGWLMAVIGEENRRNRLENKYGVAAKITAWRENKMAYQNVGEIG